MQRGRASKSAGTREGVWVRVGPLRQAHRPVVSSGQQPPPRLVKRHARHLAGMAVPEVEDQPPRLEVPDTDLFNTEGRGMCPVNIGGGVRRLNERHATHLSSVAMADVEHQSARLEVPDTYLHSGRWGGVGSESQY